MAKKPNKKRPKPAETPNITAIATRARCSRTLVLRLLRRGLSEEQIVRRAEERRARIAARGDAQSNGRVNGHAMEFPVIPVEVPFPPFAESEKRKEFFLSEIRELQARRLRSEVVPLEPLRSIVFASTQFLTHRLQAMPNELLDELGGEHTRILRTRIGAVLAEAQRVLGWECQRCGISPPPEPPPQVPARLAYYERFLKDSRTGEIEVIPLNERIDSAEWRAAHPSITFEQGFRILAAKRRWDQDMLDLLRRRSEWDLRSELPDEPPPEEPQAA